MKIIKSISIVILLFSFNFGLSQEKVFSQVKIVEVTQKASDTNSKDSVEKNAVTLQAQSIDSSKGITERTFTAETSKNDRSQNSNNRKSVYLTVNSIENEANEVFNPTRNDVKNKEAGTEPDAETRIELRAILIPIDE